MMGSRVLRLELEAGVSGAAHAHGLQVEGVDLDEVAGCQLLIEARSSPITAVFC